MSTTVDGVTHNAALKDVMYTPGITRNQIYISKVQRNGFRVLVDDDLSHAMHGRMDLQQNSSGEVKVCWFETRNGLHQAVGCVRLNQAHLTHTASVGSLYLIIGNASSKVLQKSAQYVKVIVNGSL